MVTIKIKPFGGIYMNYDTIKEIRYNINEMKLILSTGNLTKEIIDTYEARIKMWEAEMDINEVSD
jgi:hypothetical protein